MLVGLYNSASGAQVDRLRPPVEQSAFFCWSILVTHTVIKHTDMFAENMEPDLLET